MNEHEISSKRFGLRRELKGKVSWPLNSFAFILPGLSIVLLYLGGITFFGMGGWGIFILGVMLLPIIGILTGIGVWFFSSSRKWRSAAASSLVGWILVLGFAVWFWANAGN